MAEDSIRLIQAALEVRLRAYAPYSRFLVGAAVLTDSGDIFAGCNVENASYGLAICAERVAICKMVAGGQTKLAAMAVVTTGAAAPCGACRQFLAEFCDDCPVYLVDHRATTQSRTVQLSALLPDRFGPSDL